MATIPPPPVEETPKETAPQEEAPKPNGNISLKAIEAKWGGLVGKVTKERPSIGTALEHSEPVQLDGNKLIINVYDLPKFSVGNLNRNNQVIERFVEAHYGVGLKIKAEHAERNGMDAPKNLVVKEPPSSTARSQDGETVVSRVLEVFDGEILR